MINRWKRDVAGHAKAGGETTRRVQRAVAMAAIVPGLDRLTDAPARGIYNGCWTPSRKGRPLSSSEPVVPWSMPQQS